MNLTKAHELQPELMNVRYRTIELIRRIHSRTVSYRRQCSHARLMYAMQLYAFQVFQSVKKVRDLASISRSLRAI